MEMLADLTGLMTSIMFAAFQRNKETIISMPCADLYDHELSALKLPKSGGSLQLNVAHSTEPRKVIVHLMNPPQSKLA
jgi:hypothetical protein